jgi:hypothetical protein
MSKSGILIIGGGAEIAVAGAVDGSTGSAMFKVAPMIQLTASAPAVIADGAVLALKFTRRAGAVVVEAALSNPPGFVRLADWFGLPGEILGITEVIILVDGVFLPTSFCVARVEIDDSSSLLTSVAMLTRAFVLGLALVCLAVCGGADAEARRFAFAFFDRADLYTRGPLFLPRDALSRSTRSDIGNS